MGLIIPALQSSWKVEPFTIGASSRQLDGSYYREIYEVKDCFSLKTIPLEKETADALYRFLCYMNKGRAWHYFNFEDATDYKDADSGLSENAESGTIARATSDPKFGDGYLDLSTGTPTIDYTMNYSDADTGWTWMGWASNDPAGAGWEHHIVNSQGHKWIDGVRNDAGITTETVLSNGATFRFDGARADYFDDALFLPFDVNDGFVELLDLTTPMGDGLGGIYISNHITLDRLTACYFEVGEMDQEKMGSSMERHHRITLKVQEA